jgi:hypothetical protein
MATGTAGTTQTSKKAKRNRKVLTIEEKLSIIEELKSCTGRYV